MDHLKEVYAVQPGFITRFFSAFPTESNSFAETGFFARAYLRAFCTLSAKVFNFPLGNSGRIVGLYGNEWEIVDWSHIV